MEHLEGRQIPTAWSLGKKGNRLVSCRAYCQIGNLSSSNIFAYLAMALFFDNMQDRQMGKPNRITEWLKRRGVVLEELAERTGLSTSYLSRMAAGGRNVSLKNLAKVASALDIDQSDLVVEERRAINSQFSARELKIIAATVELIHLRIKMLFQVSAGDLESLIAEAISPPLSEDQHSPPLPRGPSVHSTAPKESKKPHRQKQT